MNVASIVMRHPLTGDRREIRTGFCWPAFWLGPLWAVANRLSQLAFLMMSAGMALSLIDIGGEDASLWAALLGDAGMMLLYALICGRFAHAWHRFFLQRKGYVVIAQDGGPAPEMQFTTINLLIS